MVDRRIRQDSVTPPFAYRQFVKGNEYIYLRHSGKCIRLPNLDDPEFQAAYEAAMAVVFGNAAGPIREVKRRKKPTKQRTKPLPDAIILRHILAYDMRAEQFRRFTAALGLGVGGLPQYDRWVLYGIARGFERTSTDEAAK